MSDVVPTRTTVSRRQTHRRRDPDWLRNQMPMGMLEDDFLHRYLGIFQEVADTMLHQVDTLPHMFDPAVAPMPIVRMLGAWIGVDHIDDSQDELHQRRAVRDTGPLLAWRGTRRGLEGILQIVTGDTVTVTDSGGVYLEGEAPEEFPHVSIHCIQYGPAEAADVLEIVRAEIPASVTFDLTVGDERLWPKSQPVDHIAEAS